MTMEIETKDKPVTIRIPTDLYDFFVQKALTRGQEEKRIVKVSEVMREAMEAGKNGK